VSLKAARERRDAARKLLSDGIDPAASRQEAKPVEVDTFQTVASEWYDRFSSSWAESHAVRIRRVLERDVYPWLGSRPIAEVIAPEVLSIVRRIESRGALETAHRVLGNCG
jgi:integrase